MTLAERHSVRGTDTEKSAAAQLTGAIGSDPGQRAGWPVCHGGHPFGRTSQAAQRDAREAAGQLVQQIPAAGSAQQAEAEGLCLAVRLSNMPKSPQVVVSTDTLFVFSRAHTPHL